MKIVLVGQISVGKSSLLNRFLNKNDPLKTLSTIGAEYHSFIWEGDKKIKVNFWDTSG